MLKKLKRKVRLIGIMYGFLMNLNFTPKFVEEIGYGNKFLRAGIIKCLSRINKSIMGVKKLWYGGYFKDGTLLDK